MGIGCVLLELRLCGWRMMRTAVVRDRIAGDFSS